MGISNKEEKKNIETGREIKNDKKKMSEMKMRIITCFGEWTRSGARDWDKESTDKVKESTDNFVNVFNSVTSPRAFSNRGVLQYFSTIPALHTAAEPAIRSVVKILVS